MTPLYSTHQVAQMLQVNPSSIAKWMEKGALVGFKTPGGHRRIRQEDLITFIRQHGFPMPGELKSSARSAAR